MGDLWLAIVALCALAFLAAAFLVDRLPTLARRAAGPLRGIFGLLFGPAEARLAAVIDLVPGLLALVAAFLIGPMVASQDTV